MRKVREFKFNSPWNSCTSHGTSLTICGHEYFLSQFKGGYGFRVREWLVSTSVSTQEPVSSQRLLSLSSYARSFHPGNTQHFQPVIFYSAYPPCLFPPSQHIHSYSSPGLQMDRSTKILIDMLAGWKLSGWIC